MSINDEENGHLNERSNLLSQHLGDKTCPTCKGTGRVYKSNIRLLIDTFFSRNLNRQLSSR